MTSRNTESLVLLVRAKNMARRELRSVGQDLDSVDRKAGGFKGTAAKVGKVAGAALIGLGVAAAGLSVKAVRAFGDFDDKLNQSLAIMGDVAPELRDKMSDTARQISRNTRIGANEAAESYFFLASAGLDAEQSIAALPQVAAFAQAGMFDMARATDLATDAQSALGLTVKDPTENLGNLTRVTDVLVKANTLANASVEQFSSSLTNKAGAALKVVNKDIEEGVAVLAAFADQGIKGEQAGTALNIIMRDLQTQAIKNKDAFADNNIQVFDSTGKMRNMADIVGDLEGSLEGMSDEQKKATLAQLGFNDKSVIFMQTLLGTSDQIREYEAELREAGGTTQEVADKQLESINAQFDILKNRAHDTMIGLGEDLAPTVKDELIPAMDGLIDSFGVFMETIGPTLIKTISLGVDALVGIQMVALDLIGLWDDDARRKARLIVLNKELAAGMGENLPPAQRLAAAMITLGKQNAFTEDGLRMLIATTGASAEEVAAARDMVMSHADAQEWDTKWTEMLGAATSDYTAELRKLPDHLSDGTDATVEHSDALIDGADAYDEVTESTEEALTAQQEYTNELKALSDPLFGAVRSLQDLQKAEQKVVELEKEGKKGTQEWQLAMLDMAESTIGAQGALDEMDASQLNEAIGAISTAMGISREETTKFLDELGVLDGKKIAAVIEVKAPNIRYVTDAAGNARPTHQGVSVFARGGRYYRGQPMIVGEAGWEFQIPGSSGTIVSNPNTPGGNFDEFFGGGGFDSEAIADAVRDAIASMPRAVFTGDIVPRSTATADDIAHALDFKFRSSVRPR